MRTACPNPPAPLQDAFDKARLASQSPEAKELGGKLAVPLLLGGLLFLLSLLVR